jgi:hypothetical protein
VAALSARIATLAAKMHQGSGDRWLTLDEAAELAQVPTRRVRAWARRVGVTWASWPTRKTLRIHEGRFRLWLAEPAAIDANRHESARIQPGGMVEATDSRRFKRAL